MISVGDIIITMDTSLLGECPPVVICGTDTGLFHMGAPIRKDVSFREVKNSKTLREAIIPITEANIDLVTKAYWCSWGFKVETKLNKIKNSFPKKEYDTWLETKKKEVQSSKIKTGQAAKKQSDSEAKKREEKEQFDIIFREWDITVSRARQSQSVDPLPVPEEIVVAYKKQKVEHLRKVQEAEANGLHAPDPSYLISVVEANEKGISF